MNRRADPIFDTYRVRCLLGLAASLTLMIVLVHLPVRDSSPRVGWTPQSSADQIRLSGVTRNLVGSEDGGGRARTTSASSDQSGPPQHTGSSAARSSQNDAQRQSGEKGAQRKVQTARPLGLVDRDPRIAGGMGSLYLSINYPDSARKMGIEGRLLLEFTVQTDGSVSDVQVAESLHPLCDSAAVKGVRAVDFVPAKHNGEPTPVRMRLPVRFKLTNVTTATSLNRSAP